MGKDGSFGIARPIWLGGALGLYFGWFFRPVRDPSLIMALGISLVIGIVLILLNFFKREGRLTFLQALTHFPLNVVQYFLILSVLESRHFLYDWGGRLAVLLFTGAMGVLFGIWFHWREKRVSL